MKSSTDEVGLDVDENDFEWSSMFVVVVVVILFVVSIFFFVVVSNVRVPPLTGDVLVVVAHTYLLQLQRECGQDNYELKNDFNCKARMK